MAYPTFPNYATIDQTNIGAYATVYFCQNKENPEEEVAIKYIRPTDEPCPTTVVREISFLRMLRGERHIVQFICVARMNQSFYITMQYGGESLASHIWNASLTPLGHVSDVDAEELMKGLVQSIGVLHSRNIMHRDLKPDNMLVKNGELSVCDLGTAKVVEQRADGVLTELVNPPTWDTTHDVATLLYAAPEMLRRKVYGLPVDLWAAGCVVFEILTSEAAFPPRGEPCVTTMLTAITKKLLSPSWDMARPGAPRVCIRMMECTFQRDPVNRASARALSRFVH